MTLFDYIKEILHKLEPLKDEVGNYAHPDIQELYNTLIEIAPTATEHDFCEVMAFYHYCPSSFHEDYLCPVDEFFHGCCYSCWREHIHSILNAKK